MADYDKLCRACLKIVELKKYVFFKNISTDTFWFCTSIQVLENESMPKMLCCSCYELLSKFTQFKQRCIESQQSLLNFKHIKSEVDCVDFFDVREESSLNINKVEENESDKNIDTAITKYELANECNDSNFSSDDIDKKQNVENCTPETYKELKNSRKSMNFHCSICNKSFMTKKRYINHKVTHKRCVNQCTQCHKTFRTSQGLKIHQKSIHSQLSFKDTECRLCGKPCKSLESLKQHEMRHGERQLYICDVCGKTYMSKAYLKVHIDIHNANKERNYTCEQCGKKFCSKVALQCHHYRAHSDKQYICQLCNFPYKYKNNLVKHLLTHEGIKLYKCEFCNKSFSSRTYSIEHQRVHSGERPFSCIYCPKTFISKRYLRDHHKIHTGERKNKCSVCEQSFTQRGTLMRHMKIHNKMSDLIS